MPKNEDISKIKKLAVSVIFCLEMCYVQFNIHIVIIDLMGTKVIASMQNKAYICLLEMKARTMNV